MALSNFNEQMIVHLPALLPPLSEKLSDLTRAISGLQEVVLEAQLYLRDLKSSIRPVGSTDVTGSLIDPKWFFEKEVDGKLRWHLRKDITTGEGYFGLNLLQMLGRIRDIRTKIDEFSGRYAGNWIALPSDAREKAFKAAKTITDLSEKLAVTETRIKSGGLYLVYAVVPVDEVTNDLTADTRATDVRETMERHAAR